MEDFNPMRRAVRIARWPFFFGDGLLVTTGIVLAFSARTPLDAGQMFFVVLAVGWGAVLAAAPFCIEAWLNSRRFKGSADPDETNLRNRLYALEFRVAELEETARRAERSAASEKGSGSGGDGELARRFAALRQERSAEMCQPTAASERTETETETETETSSDPAVDASIAESRQPFSQKPPELVKLPDGLADVVSTHRPSASQPANVDASGKLTPPQPTASEASVRELIQTAKPAQPARQPEIEALPTSVDEVSDTLPATKGLMRRAMRSPAGGSQTSGVGRLIRGNAAQRDPDDEL